MTIAIIIPDEDYNLDVLRTLMVNVKPAVSDVLSWKIMLIKIT